MAVGAPETNVTDLKEASDFKEAARLTVERENSINNAVESINRFKNGEATEEEKVLYKAVDLYFEKSGWTGQNLMDALNRYEHGNSLLCDKIEGDEIKYGFALYLRDALERNIENPELIRDQLEDLFNTVEDYHQADALQYRRSQIHNHKSPYFGGEYWGGREDREKELEINKEQESGPNENAEFKNLYVSRYGHKKHTGQELESEDNEDYNNAKEQTEPKHTTRNPHYDTFVDLIQGKTEMEKPKEETKE